MSLTHKQQAFCFEYVKDFNATQAAIRAGYSKKTARQIGSANLSKVDIKAEIDRVLEERIMSRDEALSRMADIARFDISPYILSYGRQTGLNLTKLIEDGYGHLVRGIKQTQNGTTVEWSNPDDAIKLLLGEMKPTGKEDDPQHYNIVINYADTNANTP